MSHEVYQQLGQTMSKRGLQGRSAEVPEYYTMLQVLFTPEEAEIQNAMPPERFTPEIIVNATGKDLKHVTIVLEDMANKGLCLSFVRNGTRYYTASPLMPGILEFQFMRGTKTPRDYEIARVIHTYRVATARATAVPARTTYPGSRVIPVGRTVKAQAAVQTYDQVVAYIQNSDPIAVTTCYCRHEAMLCDEKDVCGMPNDVCMQFRTTAEYLIERGIGKKVTREEALEVMKRAEEAGLVHACVNTQRIDFICNCCACHCAILQGVLQQPKPAEAMLHGYVPTFDAGICTLCSTCVDRCPTKALSIGNGDRPDWNADRCIGCAVCASGCQENVITMVERGGEYIPPADRKALVETMMKKMFQKE